MIESKKLEPKLVSGEFGVNRVTTPERRTEWLWLVLLGSPGDWVKEFTAVGQGAA